MSWDLFIQDWGDFGVLDDIPDDFMPQSIGKRSEVISKIINTEPTVNFSNPSLGILENEYFSIEFSMGEEEELHSFAMHVHGNELAVPCIGNILSELQLKAADGSTSNFFDTEQAKTEMAKWIAYRNQILNQ